MSPSCERASRTLGTKSSASYPSVRSMYGCRFSIQPFSAHMGVS
jgi:hypothetical protein